jgi:hypothetical protein
MLFRVKRGVIAILVVSALVIDCSPTTTAPDASAGGSAVVKPAINEQTRGEIQALLQTQNRAMSSRDHDALLATIDPDSLALKRCANEDFDIAARQGVGSAGQVGKIEAYLDTYVRAWVQEGSRGQRRLFYRKTANGKWVQSEPKEAELGGEKKSTIEDIQVEYWGVDQDAVDALGKAGVAAKKVVLANLLSDDRRDALIVRFYPTRAVAGIVGCSVAGSHLTNVATDPAIRIVRYWFTPSGELSSFTVGIIVHEWLHWAQDQFSPGVVARLPWWLAEGWPDYAGQVQRSIPCRATWPTLKQLENGADVDDPSAPPELAAQYYSYANTMIEYLYATYGGKSAYAKLLVGFKEDAAPAITFPKVLNVTSVKFYDDWTAWAKKKYCG